jgi:hypothetical protein
MINIYSLWVTKMLGDLIHICCLNKQKSLTYEKQYRNMEKLLVLGFLGMQRTCWSSKKLQNSKEEFSTRKLHEIANEQTTYPLIVITPNSILVEKDVPFKNTEMILEIRKIWL